MSLPSLLFHIVPEASRRSTRTGKAFPALFRRTLRQPLRPAVPISSAAKAKYGQPAASSRTAHRANRPARRLSVKPLAKSLIGSVTKWRQGVMASAEDHGRSAHHCYTRRLRRSHPAHPRRHDGLAGWRDDPPNLPPDGVAFLSHCHPTPCRTVTEVAIEGISELSTHEEITPSEQRPGDHRAPVAQRLRSESNHGAGNQPPPCISAIVQGYVPTQGFTLAHTEDTTDAGPGRGRFQVKRSWPK